MSPVLVVVFFLSGSATSSLGPAASAVARMALRLLGPASSFAPSFHLTPIFHSHTHPSTSHPSHPSPSRPHACEKGPSFMLVEEEAKEREVSLGSWAPPTASPWLTAVATPSLHLSELCPAPVRRWVLGGSGQERGGVPAASTSTRPSFFLGDFPLSRRVDPLRVRWTPDCL